MSEDTGPEFDYIGIKPCGCVVEATADFGDKDTGKRVAAMIASGLTVKRILRKELPELGCKHTDPEYDTVANFRRAWHEAMTGQTMPLELLWKEVDEE